MDYFFFIFCFLSILNLQVKGKEKYNHDYMEFNNTCSIKGIFVWLIIFRHKSGYGNYKNFLYKKIDNNLSQQVVSMFLFYSGFGIYESLKKKSYLYAKSLLFKAIIIFLKSQIIILIYLACNIFIVGNKITLKRYLLSVIFKLGIGNSNWFAFTIIIFYFYSFLSFSFVKTNYFLGILIISIFCLFHSILVYNYYYPKQKHTVDNVLCFVFGFYYSFAQKYLDKIIMKSDIHYFGITSAIIYIYYRCFGINNLIFISLKNTLFALLVVLITIKVKFNNDLLKFLNSHSYSIYHLQRLVMMIVSEKKIFNNNNFIQISFEFSAIFFIASLFDKYTVFIDKKFKRNSNHITIYNNKDIFL